MVTYTDRLGLKLPDGPEEVDVEVLNDDFEAIDKYIGAKVVNSGVTPPNEDLYEGAIVRERGSGISWVAVENGSGGFIKKYINYPLKVTLGGYSGSGLPSDQTYRPLPLDTVRTSWSVNADSSMLSAGQFKCPVAGLYLVQASLTFPGGFSGNAALRTNVSPESTSSAFDDMIGRVVTENVPTNQTKVFSDMTYPLTKNQLVRLEAWQNGGGASTPTGAYLVATLIAIME